MKLPGAPVAPRLPRDLDSGSTPVRREPVVDWKKVDPKVVEAAQGMEAMFIDYMMQTMRKSVGKSEMSMDNGASEIYQGMLDSEYAQRAAKAGGVGLAEQIVAYLDSNRYNQIQVDPGTGGTSHENQFKQQRDHSK
ncbi:MAG: rod-binding protein [Bdellovibrionales bacterium]|nr:rod-binding protein [Bdellovibrionales bacterium]